MKRVLREGFRQMLGLVLLATTVGVSVNLIRPNGIPLRLAQGNGPGIGFLEGGMITLEEARDILMTGKALFIDARSPALFKQGRIVGARNIPWAEAMQTPDILSGLPQDTLFIVYDDGQEALAMNLASFLVSFGHHGTRVLGDGFSRWAKEGLPRESVSNDD